MKTIEFCVKRNGDYEPFDKKMITNAVMKAFVKTGEGNRFLAVDVTETVVDILIRNYQYELPHVENIQDIVEDVLISFNFKLAAKEYIRYRHERNKERKEILL